MRYRTAEIAENAEKQKSMNRGCSRINADH
jgi:hypothetical protein